LLFGIWPIGILGLAGLRIGNPPHPATTNQKTLETIAMLLSGFLAVVVALVAYYLYTGALRDFLYDFFVGAAQLTKLDHLQAYSYLYYLLGKLGDLRIGDPLGLANRFYWWGIILVAALNGGILWRMIARNQIESVRESILPLMATFHALVAIFNQIGFYLYVTAGLSLTSLIWLLSKRSPGWSVGLPAVALCAISVYSHAGQPYTRDFSQLLRGERMPLVRSTIPKAGTFTDRAELAIYQELVSVIQENSDPGAFILALPNNPEVYFLADRPNAFRHMNTTISLNGPAEIRSFLAEFDQVSPKLVVHDTKQQYNTADTETILAHVRTRYDLFAEIDRFAIFALRGEAPPNP
jgi:hypothetical protein